MQPGTRYQLEVNPKLPKRLARLEELAGNLWYSWDRATRAIFARLNPALWDAVGHNPKAMLKRIDEQRPIDAEGRQRTEYHDSEFTDLPIEPVQKAGRDLIVELAFPGRKLVIKVWQARIGHVRLFLLDTDVPENSERDRAVAHRLYGGDRTTRLEQELVLGVGGVRALCERRLAHPRRRVAALAERFLAAGHARGKSGRLCHQRRARHDVSRARMGRGARPLPRRGLDASARTSGDLGKNSRHPRPHLLERAPGHQGTHAAHAAPSHLAPAPAQPRQRVAPRAPAALLRSRQAPHPHDRVRAALRHLQAGDAALQ